MIAAIRAGDSKTLGDLFAVHLLSAKTRVVGACAEKHPLARGAIEARR